MPKKTPAAPKPPSLSLERVTNLFLANARSRRLSESSVAWYTQRLGHFTVWLAKELGRELTLDDFTASNFQLFVLEKQAGGTYDGHPYRTKLERAPSSAYMHGYFRAVKALASFITEQELVAANPMAKLKMPKLEEKQLQPLTESEEQKLLQSYDEATPSGCRIKAILMLMLDAGLRKSEVITLKFADVHIDEGFLLIKGKGSKERWLPFGHKTGWMLQRYVTLYRPEPFTPNVDTFFLDPEGNPMTRNALKMVFDRISKKTGITRLHPHLMRHTFGIRSQEMNIPSLTLQRYMGHADVRTTERYAHAAQSEKIKRERGFSHLDQLPVKVKKVAKGRKQT